MAKKQCPQAWITVGLPASGKSTFAQSLGVTMIERDMIRTEIASLFLGGYFSWKTWPGDMHYPVQSIWRERLDAALEAGADLVVSDTNLVAEHRQNLIKDVFSFGYEATVVVFDVSEDECRRRNQNRENPVLDTAFDVLRPLWEIARSEIKAEAKTFGFTLKIFKDV